MAEEQKKKKKQHNKFLALTSLSIQMGVTIYLGSYFGGLLDEHNNSENNEFTTVFTLIAVAISMYFFVQQAQKINND